MSLTFYKLLTAVLIAFITLIIGFASLRFIRQQKHFLQVSDALADGIFLGVAFFHLFPDATAAFRNYWHLLPTYLLAFACMIGGFCLLFILERTIIHREHVEHHSITTACKASAWMLAGILSVHAFIEGAALGISPENGTVLVLLIAILAHKGFETYALVTGLHRNLPNPSTTKKILSIFAFVTPVGIIVATAIEQVLQIHVLHLITGIFSAFAAGSFLYIGTLHTTHTHFHPARDRSDRYLKISATALGIAVMGILAIWL